MSNEFGNDLSGKSGDQNMTVSIGWMRTLLYYLKRGTCWCEIGIGNPMVKGHGTGCVMAQQMDKIVNKPEEKP